jgi:hypothetical protein
MAKTGPKKGEPLIPIDWDEVYRLLKAQLNGVQIAGTIGVKPKTLYRRCEDELGIKFLELRVEKRAIGIGMIRMRQFEIATELGDKEMLRWLGKQYDGQKDKHDVTSNDETVKPSWTVNVVDPKKED